MTDERVGLRLDAITPGAVRHVLQSVRHAAATPSSPLLGLDTVTEALGWAAADASEDARFIVLSTLLADTTWAALERLRPVPLTESRRLSPDEEIAWLVRDFHSNNEEREAWSALHFHYFGFQTEIVALLKRLDIPYHTFRRRRLRGCEFLAGKLRAIEVETRRKQRGAQLSAALDSGGADTDRDRGTAVRREPTAPALVALHPPPEPLSKRKVRPLAAIVVTAMLALLATPSIVRLTRDAWQGSTLVGDMTTSPSPPTRILVIGPVDIEPPQPRMGELVTATFRIKNNSGEPRVIPLLKAGGRGPHACSRNWNAPNVDFPAIEHVQLAPGEEYVYRGSRTFSTPGDYFAEPVQMAANRHWGGIGPSPRAWFNIADGATGAVSPPDCLMLTRGISVEPSVVATGSPFTVTARIKNASRDIVLLQTIVVAMRESDARQGAWGFPTIFVPSKRNVTLQPNEEITYTQSRIATDVGTFLLEVVVQQDGKWSGIWPFGATEFVVRADQSWRAHDRRRSGP